MRLCSEPGCCKLVERGRCAVHAAEQNKRHRSAHAGFYSTKRWRLTRRRKLHTDPICELCENALAEEVHHRVPLAHGGDPYRLDGLVSCCKPCHSRETRREQLERLR